MLIFHFFFEKIVKIPMCKSFKFFRFFNFCTKSHLQNPHRYDFEFFCKKSRFLHTLEIINFSWDNHVIYRKKNHFFFRFSTHFPNSWQVEISLFSIIFTIVQTPTPPPLVLLRKRQKVSKFYLWVFRQKLEKHDYQS